MPEREREKERGAPTWASAKAWPALYIDMLYTFSKLNPYWGEGDALSPDLGLNQGSAGKIDRATLLCLYQSYPIKGGRHPFPRLRP